MEVIAAGHEYIITMEINLLYACACAQFSAILSMLTLTQIFPYYATFGTSIEQAF